MSGQSLRIYRIFKGKIYQKTITYNLQKYRKANDVRIQLLPVAWCANETPE